MTGDVRGFYAQLGVGLPAINGAANVAVRCFANPDAHRHEDKNASASISLDSGAWLCHACGARGGPYDAALRLGRTGADAMALLDDYGLRKNGPGVTNGRDSGSSRSVAQRPESRPKLRASEADVERWHRELLAADEVADRLATLRGWSKAALERLEVGLDRRTPDHPVVFPARDARGQLVAIQRYQPNPDKRSGKKAKADSGSARALYPAPETLSGSELWLLEGEPDAVAGHSIGLPAVGLPGAESWQPAWAPRFAGRDVIVAFDCDDAGRRAAECVAAAVQEHARSVRILDLDPNRGDGWDVGDLVREAGGLAADVLRDAARRVPPITRPEKAPIRVDANGARPPSPEPPGWPAALASEAFHGLAGEIVRTLEPHSEADPAALLVQTLVAFGNLVGRGPGFRAEGDFHATNLYAVVVGRTSKGRKGTSWGRVREVAEVADAEWAANCVTGGLASGEGLIYQVRDEERRMVPVKERGRATGEYVEEVVDQGVADKRLLVVQGEFAQVLKVMAREGNTLSPILRELWDRGDARTLTKNNPGKTTGAHVSIVGHVTRDELRRELSATEAANGFANRFLFVCAHRSKLLPEGGNLHPAEVSRLGERLADAAAFARRQDILTRDAAATELWRRLYTEMATERPGMVGAVTSRGEAQVMRLATLYALLDHAGIVGVKHLEAAYALWRYCEASAAHVFGDRLGDPIADEILTALRGAGTEGMTRTQIRDMFARHKSAGRIGLALEALRRQGVASVQTEASGGRPVERWRACDQSDKSDETRRGGAEEGGLVASVAYVAVEAGGRA